MKLKFACADFSFPLLSHGHVLDLISILDIPAVDIGIFGGRSHIRPENIVHRIPAAARDLSAQVKDRGLELADIFLIPGSFEVLAPNDPNAKTRQKSRDLFLKILEFTVRCKAKHMGGLPGIPWKGESKATSFDRTVDELAWRCAKAKEVGVVYSVEPHAGSITPTPKEALKLAQSTDGLTLTLDYSHFTLKGMPDSAVEPLIRYASHFHVRGACKGRIQAAFKQNTIDFKRVVKVMKQTGYKGYLGLEYVWIDWFHGNEVDNLSESILMRDFLKPLL